LGDTVIDGFAGIDGCLEVGVLERQHGTTALSSLVTGTGINENTKMNVGRNGD